MNRIVRTDDIPLVEKVDEDESKFEKGEKENCLQIESSAESGFLQPLPKLILPKREPPLHPCHQVAAATKCIFCLKSKQILHLYPIAFLLPDI